MKLFHDHDGHIYLNGKKARKRELNQLIHALGNLEIIAEKGGYLFKFLFEGKDFHFGIIPNIINHARSYHYDIPMRIENEFTFVGGVDAQGIFNILFKPTERPLPEEKRIRYALGLSNFSQWILERGYEGPGSLDWITRQIIDEAGLFNDVPVTIQELSEMGMAD